MRTLACLSFAALLGCGTPPNHRVLTRTSDYLKAMSLGQPSGHPFDIAELERRIPELKGIVVTAPQWIDEYEKMRQEADNQGKALYTYRITYGTHLTLEVTGEAALTRSYSVPPSGDIYYPHLSKLRVVGLTPDELKEKMESELAVYLKKPEVLIHINTTPYQPSQSQPFLQQSFGGADIIVMGAAQSRFFNNISFTGRETLVHVLGITSLPNNVEWRQIRVIRRDAKEPLRKSRVIVCDLWDYFAKADVRQDIPLAPGDVIFVPVRWSTDDQFWEDWGYMKKVINEVFFLDSVKEAARKGGVLRD